MARRTVPGSLVGPELGHMLGLEWPGMPPLLIDALPRAGFDPVAWRPAPLPALHPAREGERIDLGDRAFEVRHLPGHTAGDLVLLDRADGTLITGDVLYDGELLDGLAESDADRYAESLLRLRDLPVSILLPGHGDPFDADRMRELVDAHLAARSSRYTRRLDFGEGRGLRTRP